VVDNYTCPKVVLAERIDEKGNVMLVTGNFLVQNVSFEKYRVSLTNSIDLINLSTTISVPKP